MNPNLPNPAPSQGSTPAGDPAKSLDIRHLAVTALLLAVFFGSLFSGYRFGKDLALKHNYQDCVAEGRSDCRLPSD